MVITLLDGTPVLTLAMRGDEQPGRITGRLDGTITPVTFAWNTSKARSIQAALLGVAVPVPDLDNGMPDRAYSGRVFAQVRNTGRIINLSYYDDGDLMEGPGLLVVTHSQLGEGGGKVQALEMVFYPMTPGSALRGPAGDVIDRVPDVEDEEFA